MEMYEIYLNGVLSKIRRKLPTKNIKVTYVPDIDCIRVEIEHKGINVMNNYADAYKYILGGKDSSWMANHSYKRWREAVLREFC